MPKLDEFVTPRPWPALSRVLNQVNRVLMLHGIPLLRDVPILNSVPGIRGLTGIRRIVADNAEFAKLKALCAGGDAVFMLPNHPEFFTDWMLDKDIIARCAPDAASWATNGVVNGMGAAMQKFWLWNNLIAQIPGDTMSAKSHSVQWALKGKGVLLHPEGMVGWHSNFVAPLMPGAADMAKDAQDLVPGKTAWLIPIVWKLKFEHDVTAGLSNEAAYVERRLNIPAKGDLAPASRVHAIYVELLDRELDKLGLKVIASMPLHEKLETVQTVLALNLASTLGEEVVSADQPALIAKARKAARALREDSSDKSKALTSLADSLQRHRRLGAFAMKNLTISQEEIADHLKRLRNDWCKGTLRDTVNAYLPQSVGPRTAYISILDPISVKREDASKSVMETVRQAMQAELDRINTSLSDKAANKAVANPFYAH